jgi:hypothetical protein
MSAGECEQHVRKELSRCCRKPRGRSASFSPAAPTDWNPSRVADPRDEEGRAFSDLTVWDYVADLLDQGTPVEVITLDKPRGKTGYVMKVPSPGGVIYIKLQLSPPGVLGRSFHYSTNTFHAK